MAVGPWCQVRPGKLPTTRQTDRHKHRDQIIIPTSHPQYPTSPSQILASQVSESFPSSTTSLGSSGPNTQPIVQIFHVQPITPRKDFRDLKHWGDYTAHFHIFLTISRPEIKLYFLKLHKSQRYIEIILISFHIALFWLYFWFSKHVLIGSLGILRAEWGLLSLVSSILPLHLISRAPLVPATQAVLVALLHAHWWVQ